VIVALKRATTIATLRPSPTKLPSITLGMNHTSPPADPAPVLYLMRAQR
jgi:hypothetical protein